MGAPFCCWGGRKGQKGGKNAIIQNELYKLHNLICIIQKNVVILRGRKREDCRKYATRMQNEKELDDCRKYATKMQNEKELDGCRKYATRMQNEKELDDCRKYATKMKNEGGTG